MDSSLVLASPVQGLASTRLGEHKDPSTALAATTAKTYARTHGLLDALRYRSLILLGYGGLGTSSMASGWAGWAKGSTLDPMGVLVYSRY